MDWPEAQLSDLVEISQPGLPQHPAPSQDGLPYLSSNNIANDVTGHLILDEIGAIVPPPIDIEEYSLQSGDILLCCREPGGIPGKTTYFEASRQYLFSDHLLRLRLKTNVIEPKFLARYLHWHWWAFEFRNTRTVTTQTGESRISSAQLARLSVPLPPISEQLSLIEILDQVAELLEKRKTADIKTSRIILALYHHVIGDPASNPNGWPVLPLEQLFLGNPQVGLRAKAPNWRPGTPRYIRPVDIKDDDILTPFLRKTTDSTDWEQFRLSSDDVLLVRRGPTAGQLCYFHELNGDYVFSESLVRFTVNRELIEPLVVGVLAQTAYYKSWVRANKKGTTVPRIDIRDVGRLPVPYPDRESQKLFVAAAQDVINIRERGQGAKRRAESLFTHLLNEGFSGYLTANLSRHG